jgi:hypothetical protein
MAMNMLHALELDELNQSELAEEIFMFGVSDETVERFRVRDLESANWCFRKLQALMAKTNEVNGLADKEIQRINAWREKELHHIQQQVEFFERLLTEYHAECLKKDPKAKTITTPYGKLKSITRKPAPKKVDDEVLLRHLKESGETEYIVVKESPAWGEYKKTLQVVDRDGIPVVVDQNGLEVPGVEVDLGGVSFKVEVSE